MANTAVNSGNVVTKFQSEFFREWLRGNRFARYTGTGMNNVICIKEDRKKVSIPLVTRLTGSGVSGSATLRGSGENIGNYADTLTPTYYRHAVEFDKEELEKPEIDLMRAARPLLMDWAMELVRNQTIDAMSAFYDGTTYANATTASETVKDGWLGNNTDRVLFGAALSNRSTTDHSASLANVDSTTDVLDPGLVSLAKRIAKTADRHIRPLTAEEDDETYILFAGSRAFRDFYNDTGYQANLQNAMQRGKDNPLFRPGDLFHDNVIIREVPEITTRLTASAAFATAGASSIAVEPCFLCGTQAIGFGLGQRPQVVIDRDYDYGFQPGVAVELKHHIKKLFWNNIQNGVVTVYVSGVADS